MRLIPSLRSILLSCAVALLVSPMAHAREMVSVAKQVNMRSGAGTQHDALWLLEPGYPLQVVDRRGAWLRVRDFENDRGWVYRPLTNKVRHHVVKSKAANIRQRPSTRAPILGRAVYGEVLKTVERREGWVKVRQSGGTQGWVANRLLWGW
ncbi:SH3 domain-containing protein [Aquincola sp. MAHUQ-54]|uniref:SH3 domain-containing protein n=1 Tax=Aquincola agrisoli TaxID=3119538 RepID=A0AAW9QRJ4_9BURK